MDNILPILDDAVFTDDLVTKFIHFVQVSFGKKTLVENLDFIASALKKRADETALETIRRYFIQDFFKDHVRTYKKRPIYWLFSSGKEKAFQCLVYMHRYEHTTLSRLRTDYLHVYQHRLEVEKAELLVRLEENTAEKVNRILKKELAILDRKIAELQLFDEKLHHLADKKIKINPHVGVAENYQQFNGIVAEF